MLQWVMMRQRPQQPPEETQPPQREYGRDVFRRLLFADVLIVGIGIFFALRFGAIYWLAALCGLQIGLLYSRYRYLSWSAYARAHAKRIQRSAAWYVGYSLCVIALCSLWGVLLVPRINLEFLIGLAGLVFGGFAGNYLWPLWLHRQGNTTNAQPPSASWAVPPGAGNTPKGIAVVGVLLLAVAAFSVALLFYFPDRARILGFGVPRHVGAVEAAILAIVSIYCGIGFFGLKRKAFQVYLALAAYLSIGTVIGGIVDSVTQGADLAPEERYHLYAVGMVGVLCALTIICSVVYYVVRRRNYFAR